MHHVFLKHICYINDIYMQTICKIDLNLTAIIMKWRTDSHGAVHYIQPLMLHGDIIIHDLMFQYAHNRYGWQGIDVRLVHILEF